MDKLTAILNALAKSNGYLQLAISGTTLVAGLVKSVKSMGGEGDEVEYELVLKIGRKELAEAEQHFDSTISKIDQELARLGQSEPSEPEG